MSIIRTEQNWLPKSVDTLLTLAAWAGFIYLTTNGAAPFIKQVIANPEQYQKLFVRSFMPLIKQISFYLLEGALLGAILVTWAKYNQLRAPRRSRRGYSPSLCDWGLSKSFSVSTEDLSTLRSIQVLILHNTEHGNLAWIENPRSLQPKVRSINRHMSPTAL